MIEEERDFNDRPRPKKVRKSRFIFAPWSKEETKKLINLYKTNPILWDIALQEYRDVPKKNRVIMDIATDLGKEPDDVKMKWQNLKCQYNGEKRKSAKHGQGVGGLLASRWKYFDSMKFTEGGNTQRTDSLTNLETLSSNSNSVNLSSNVSSVNSDSGQSSALMTGRKRKNKEQTTDQEFLLKAALDTMNNSTDSCQIFGEFVADQLRQLPPDKAKKLRLKIQRDILEACEEDCASTQIDPVLYCKLVENSVQGTTVHSSDHES